MPFAPEVLSLDQLRRVEGLGDLVNDAYEPTHPDVHPDLTELAPAMAPAIEQAGALDADKLVAIMEERDYMVPSGRQKYIKDAEGRHLHDLKWGPGYLTSLGVQWQDGELKGVWPNRWKPAEEAPEITYKGIVSYKIPPWVIEKYKK